MHFLQVPADADMAGRGPHFESKDLRYGFQNLPGHEGDLKCVCRNFRFSGSPSSPLTKPSPENGPGNQYFLVSVSETSYDQAGLKALTSDGGFRSYQLTMSSLSPLCLYWKFSTRAEENHLGSLRILLLLLLLPSRFCCVCLCATL